MAHIKLPYGEIVEVSVSKAEGIKRAMISGDQRDRLIDLGTRTIKLGQVKEVDTAEVSKKPGEKEEKYDLTRDKVFLTGFGNEVELLGSHLEEEPESGHPYQFETYCLRKGYILGSVKRFSINTEKHGEYSDAREKWEMVKKLRDLSMSREDYRKNAEVFLAAMRLKRGIRLNELAA